MKSFVVTKLHILAAVLTFALLMSALPALAAPKVQTMERPSLPEQAYAAGEVLVKYKNSNQPFEVVKVPNVERAIVAMSKNPNVEFVEPNYVLSAFATVNDPYYSYQWNFDTFESTGGVGAEAAWDVTAGAGTVVAVIDTGVAYENYTVRRGRVILEQYAQAPDLSGTCFVPGYDFVNGNTRPNDDNGHGTHVAGTIAQTTNNGYGVAGLAYESCIMPVKVLAANGSGYTSDVALGIRFAADNGADVINLSLGGPGSDVLRDAVKHAYELGATVVAATGNENTAVSYPAAYDEYVIAVGATGEGGGRASYSNYGSSVDLVAPGSGILQETLDGSTTKFNFYFYSGTSMAAPHVAAAAAMVLANGNASTPDEVRAALESTARDLGATGWDQYYGHGIIDVPAALAWSSTNDGGSGGGDGNDGGDNGDVTEPEPEPEPSPISLTVTGEKVRGVMTAYLNWGGTESLQVDVFRNGTNIVTVDDTVSYTDTIGRGGGTYTYKVCETNSKNACSAEVTVSF